MFPSRVNKDGHLSTRQYSRIVKDRVKTIGEDPSRYGMHSLRRTKVTIKYRPMHNLRAAQILLSHTKIENTVKYLGVELDEALSLSEQVEVYLNLRSGKSQVCEFPAFLLQQSLPEAVTIEPRAMSASGSNTRLLPTAARGRLTPSSAISLQPLAGRTRSRPSRRTGQRASLSGQRAV